MVCEAGENHTALDEATADDQVRGPGATLPILR